MVTPPSNPSIEASWRRRTASESARLSPPTVKRDNLPYSGGTPLTGGFIAIQSETAPTDFRKIEIVNLEGCADPKAKNYRPYIVKADQAMCKF